MNINIHQIIKGKVKKMKTYLFKVVLEEDPFEDGRMAYHVFCPT